MTNQLIFEIYLAKFDKNLKFKKNWIYNNCLKFSQNLEKITKFGYYYNSNKI